MLFCSLPTQCGPQPKTRNHSLGPSDPSRATAALGSNVCLPRTLVAELSTRLPDAVSSPTPSAFDFLLPGGPAKRRTASSVNPPLILSSHSEPPIHPPIPTSGRLHFKYMAHRLPPGSVRDAIIQHFQTTKTVATVDELVQAAEASLGTAVPRSSVRSYSKPI